MEETTFPGFFSRDPERAFEWMFKTHYARVYASVFRLLRDEGLSHDVCQDLFRHLWQKRKEWTPPGQLEAYLRKAGVNRALNELRRRKEVATEEEMLQVPSLDPEPGEREELARILEWAINQLPPTCRLVFLLKKEEGLSHQQISEQLGISLKTVENHMTKALGRLRELLKDHRNFKSE